MLSRTFTIIADEKLGFIDDIKGRLSRLEKQFCCAKNIKDLLAACFINNINNLLVVKILKKKISFADNTKDFLSSKNLEIEVCLRTI